MLRHHGGDAGEPTVEIADQRVHPPRATRVIGIGVEPIPIGKLIDAGKRDEIGISIIAAETRVEASVVGNHVGRQDAQRLSSKDGRCRRRLIEPGDGVGVDKCGVGSDSEVSRRS